MHEPNRALFIEPWMDLKRERLRIMTFYKINFSDVAFISETFDLFLSVSKCESVMKEYFELSGKMPPMWQCRRLALIGRGGPS